MTINIKLVASLQVGRFETRLQDYPQQPSVQQVLDDLGLVQNNEIIILINGIHALPNAYLSDQDILTLLPFVDGG